MRVDDSIAPAPGFGRSDASDESVFAFYHYWESFVTVVSFAWMDRYDRREASNRMERRAIDKFNKKLRSEAREKYIDLVRNLVEFCKSRDPRYKLAREARQLDKEKLQRSKAEERERKRRERVAKEEQAREDFEAQEQARLDAERLEGKDVFKLAEEEEKPAAAQTVIQCEICAKSFKSEKQFANHERSKKHKEKLKHLRESLRRQEEEAKRKQRVRQAKHSAEKEGERAKKVSGSAAQKTEEREEETESSEDSDDESDDDDYLEVFYKSSARRREASSEEEQGENDEEQSEEEEILQSKTAGDNSDKDDEEDKGVRQLQENDGPISDNESAKLSSRDNGEATGDSTDKDAQEQSENITESIAGAKEAAYEVPAEDDSTRVKLSNQSTVNSEQAKDNCPKQICGICKATFPSRNQLFKHIKATGHAELKAEAPASKRQQRRKGKKKR